MSPRCIDDNNKYKLFGRLGNDRVGSIQLEIKACVPDERADPSTCETDEAKVLEYLHGESHLRVDLLTNAKTYDTRKYGDETIHSYSKNSFYYIDTRIQDTVYWETSFNKIESEESFLPITSDSREYEFFQTKESQNGK